MGYHIPTVEELNLMLKEVGTYAGLGLLDQEHAAYYCERIIITLGMNLSEIRQIGHLATVEIPDDPVVLEDGKATWTK